MRTNNTWVALLLLALVSGTASAQSASQSAEAPFGVHVTPLAAAGANFETLNPALPSLSDYRAGQAVTSVVSPDARTLLVLTSGYNRVRDDHGALLSTASNEYVFVFDISTGVPVQRQVLQISNTYMGVAFAPDGRHFYVSGGVDDSVHVYAMNGGAWAESALVRLGHTRGRGVAVRPQAAGIAVAPNGSRLIVANFYNDSISVVPLLDGLPNGAPVEVSLQRGRGASGGTYPFWVAMHDNDTAYVSSMRDREIDVIHLDGSTPTVSARIPVQGNPNRMILDRTGARLFVASDNADTVSIINTRTERVVRVVRTIAPAAFSASRTHFHGVAPNSLALSPDENRLYVTNGGESALAVLALDRPTPAVIGLIPTGYWPNSVSVSANGRMLFVVNGKSVPGPNPGGCSTSTDNAAQSAHCGAANQYILSLSKAGLLSLPTPSDQDLSGLTRTVAANNHLFAMEEASDRAMMAALHQRIRHIIYVVRENRSYDQILGDLEVGNGDPALAEFGRAITPNAHALARHFVTLDNFYDAGEVSGNGWPWSTSADESDIGAKNLPLNYAGRGLSYDWEGTNRNVDVALGALAARQAELPGYPNDPDLLPGTANVAAPDGSGGERQQGYLWDAALRAGLAVRNYGFMLDLSPYQRPNEPISLLEDPSTSGVRVAFAANPQLAPVTDPYFRGFDTRFPDYDREREWEREFQAYVSHRNLPALSLVRLMRDHMGDFGASIDGLNTPEAQVADNDYAVGKLIEAVARSPYASSTLIFVVEDDAQDGPDHVDAQRSVAFVAGPYVHQSALVSERYSTVNLLRTIEDILGIGHLSIYDAYQRPMTAIFDLNQSQWTYNAIEPAPFAAAFTGEHRAAGGRPSFSFAQSQAYWVSATAGMDWSAEDLNPAAASERIYWRGLMAGRPYPFARSGVDLRSNRGRLLGDAPRQ